MDCLDRSLSETETPPPFQHLVTEQAKSFLALQELQNEVGALLEFRDLVMESFPHLRVKMECLTTTPATSHSSPHSSASKWEPGVRVRRKLGSASGREDIVPSLIPRSRSNSHGKGPKSGENSSSAGSSAVQDSGFCTESKEHSASSSSTTGGVGGGGGGRKNKEVEDELMNLLDMIQAKGTALRLEVEYLTNQLCSGGDDLTAVLAANQSRTRRKCRSLEALPSSHSESTDTSAPPCGRPRDELFGLKKERDLLARRVAEMEQDSVHNLAQTNQLLAEVGALSAEKRYLEERLATLHHDHSSHWRQPCFTPVKHYEVDDEGREMSSTNPYKETGGLILGGNDLSGNDLHTPVRPSDPLSRKFNHSPSSPCIPKTLGALDGIVSSPSNQMRSPRGVKLSRYKTKMAAILRESHPLELQRHLLTTVFHNEILTYQVDNITKSRVELVCQLAKIKEENEDLKFQLEEKNIELEGTRARVRLYERLQTVKMGGVGGEREGVHTLVPANPILPQLTLPCGGDQPLSSSTESAHHDDSASGSSMDKLSVTRSPSKRRTSKIPLKSYSAPKPPADLGNHGNKLITSTPLLSSSIPKYQKDASWNSNQSRKSGESLSNGGTTAPPPPSSRNWDNTSKTSHVAVKKPAILSNKELSLANRRESPPNKPHHQQQQGVGKLSGGGDTFARRMRKTSSESSSNSSGSSPRYARDLQASPVIKKLSTRPVTQGPDTKLKPPTPLRKLGRPHRSRSLEKSSIITLPAVDEVNECPDSLDMVVPSGKMQEQSHVTKELNQSNLANGYQENQSNLSNGTQGNQSNLTSGTLGNSNLNGTQELVKDVYNNSDTYVVKRPEVRQSIPEFSNDHNTSKSHTYRVRKPNRFIDTKGASTEPCDHDVIESATHVRQPNGQILATPPIAPESRNSIEYFDSIETSTSASGSVFYSAPGSSMNSNRPPRESLAECDSLDQSQPDISDSDDLV